MNKLSIEQSGKHNKRLTLDGFELQNINGYELILNPDGISTLTVELAVEIEKIKVEED